MCAGHAAQTGAAAPPQPDTAAAAGVDHSQCKGRAREEELVEMTVEEILNGRGDEFPGLIKLIKQYLDATDVDVDTRCTISQYLHFIQVSARASCGAHACTQKRASGEIWTLAHWIRNFVRSHADYKFDSVVSERINYDLIKTVFI